MSANPPSQLAVGICAAPPELAATVAMGWSLKSTGDARPGFYEFLPDGSANLILRVSSTSCRMVLLGPVTEKATIEIGEGAEYLGVRFRAGQVPGLADYTPGELVDGRVELSSLAGASVESLAEQLRALPELEARQALLAEQLRRCQPLARDPRCRRAASLLEARSGGLPIHQLAESLGLHVRSLERLFVSHLGIAPKRLARILRLRKLLARMHQGDFASLAELAFDCGYSDQAHMTREFKELTGRLPGEPQPARSRRLAGPDQTRVVHRCRP